MSVTKLINKWLIILTVLFIVVFAVNKLTSKRFEVKGNFIIDTITSEVWYVNDKGSITYVK